MKFAFKTKSSIPNGKELENKVSSILTKEGYIYDEINPDIVITFGGDGTLLSAVHKYIDNIENIMRDMRINFKNKFY